MGIQTTIKEIRNQLPDQVRLVAVSKFHPIQAIEEAYAAGQRIFGESKVQEMDEKHAALPSDIEWHFIGHLQTNKVKYIVPYVSMIHAVDSYKLLVEINKQAAKCGRTIPCLLEIHIAQEDSKFGFTFQECRDMLKAGEWQSLTHVDICGVMGMATNTDNEAQVYHEFETIYHFFEELKSTYFKAASSSFKEVSMGMSHDYPLAIRAGSTLVRIGSKIFGERNY